MNKKKSYRIQTKFGRAGNLPNVITHAKFQIDWKNQKMNCDFI